MTPLRYCFSTSVICFWAVSISWSLFLRDDHVIDADGNTGLGRFAEAELLELVERDDGLFVAADLVAVPDQVAELASCPTTLFGKPISSGQISLKITRPTVVSMTFSSASPYSVLLAEVRVREANAFVRLDRAVRISENHFALRAETASNVLRHHRRRRGAGSAVR